MLINAYCLVILKEKINKYMLCLVMFEKLYNKTLIINNIINYIKLQEIEN